MNKLLHIPTISCSHCLRSIERELGFVDGVVYLNGDAKARTVNLECSDAAALDEACSVLADIGFAPAE